MDNKRIELYDESFMSTMTPDKLENMCGGVFREEAHVSDIWLDYGELGDVVIIDVQKKGGVQRFAYGQFGRVIPGHLDLATMKYVDAYYAWPSTEEDYMWFLNMALYNKNYVKYGKNYLDYSQDAIMTAITNKIPQSDEERFSQKKLGEYVCDNFKLLNKSYKELIPIIGGNPLFEETHRTNVVKIFITDSNDPEYTM